MSVEGFDKTHAHAHEALQQTPECVLGVGCREDSAPGLMSEAETLRGC